MTISTAIPRGAVAIGLAFVAPIGTAVYAQPTSTGSGQAYPAKNIILVVPYPPGGGTDLFARVIAHDLAKQFDRQLVVDNRSGANGNIGAELVAKAAPDGYTLLYTASPIAVSRVLSKVVRFDAQRDLRPISMTISIPLVLAVHPSLPVRNVKELIALAKAKPGALTYSSSGPGASGHFTMELLNFAGGIDTRHVAYRGAAPALTSVLSGETQMAFLVPPLVQPHIASGKLRVVAVSSRTRSPVLPNVPTVQEQGLRDFEALQWHGFFAPAAVPDVIVKVLHGAVVKALASPDVKSKLAAEGASVVGSSPAEFAAFFQKELVKWTEIAKRAGIQPE
ncbi:MAG TPA: tripartite tricarboxylate transporter substrate binding protein [Burkholderiales bacterium]|nr:tripartite tricarboxylate transporter substrate binding protein [Burkholderiales bacterium]